MFDSAVFGHARAFPSVFVYDPLGELDACHVDFTNELFALLEHSFLSLVAVVYFWAGSGTWHDGMVVENKNSARPLDVFIVYEFLRDLIHQIRSVFSKSFVFLCKSFIVKLSELFKIEKNHRIDAFKLFLVQNLWAKMQVHSFLTISLISRSVVIH